MKDIINSENIVHNKILKTSMYEKHRSFTIGVKNIEHRCQKHIDIKNIENRYKKHRTSTIDAHPLNTTVYTPTTAERENRCSE